MSARPLPVTATFKPKDYYERFHPGLIYRHDEALSDDSAGSTESLTSILQHHSSSESFDEEEEMAGENGILGRQTWAKLQCFPDDCRSDQSSSPLMPRWPAGGNKAITKEFLAPREAFAHGDLLQWNAQEGRPAVYVHQASRQRRLIAAPRAERSPESPARPAQRSVPSARLRKQRAQQAASLSPDPHRVEEETSIAASEEKVLAEEREDGREEQKEDSRPSSDADSEQGSRSQRPSDSRTSAASRSLGQSSDTLAGSEDLSPWEKWLLEKERHLRKQQLREARRLAKEKKEEERAAREKAEKLEREKEKVQAWMEDKNKQLRKQQKREEAVKRAARAKEEQEKAAVAEKAKAKFEDWCQTKLHLEAAAKSKQEEEERNQSIQKEEKLKKAAEAYEKWLQAAKSRPPSSHFSFGFSDGKLTGYYDSSSNPPPSYVNPQPWCHPNPGRRRKC